MTWRERLDEEVRTLQTMRDELRVQMHLGTAEAKEAWENAEERFDHLEGRLKVLGEASRESAEQIGEAARLLARELRDGYRHVRELL